MIKNKLTIAQKTGIALTSGNTKRELGKEYGVHHSRIAEIQAESKKLIAGYWQAKAERVGRPLKKVLPEQAEILALKKQVAELKHNMALKNMKIDWLELNRKWDDELLSEIKKKRNKQLKKNKK